MTELKPPGDLRVTLPVEPEIYAGYEALRPQGAIHWDPALKGWRVLSYASCDRVERDEMLFAHPDRRDIVGDDEVYRMIQHMHGGARSLILLQGEKHKQLHGLIARELTFGIRALTPVMRDLVRRHVAAMSLRPEFVREFADVLPTAVISAVFDLPWVDDEEVLREARRCTTAIGHARETLERGSEAWRKGAEAATRLTEMLTPFVEARRDSGASDLISRLWAIGRQVYDDWGADDVVAQCRVVFFAGSNSSTHFLSNIAYVLATNPSLLDVLRGQDERTTNFVEEVLRVVPPVQGRPRIATRDIELEGVRIAAGDVLYLFNGAANRDPARYADPAAIKIDERPRLHLAFNAGVRACVGASVARSEGREFVAAMADRFASIGIDPDRPPPQFVGGLNMGFAPLHLVLNQRTGWPA